MSSRPMLNLDGLLRLRRELFGTDWISRTLSSRVQLPALRSASDDGRASGLGKYELGHSVSRQSSVGWQLLAALGHK
jgi:hypothetical protein